MKFLPLLFAAVAALAAPQAEPPSDPLWSVRLSLKDQGSPLQRELIEQLKPLMGHLPMAKFAQDLERLEIHGLLDKERPQDAAVIVNMHFGENFPSRILETLKARSTGDAEPIDGQPVLHIVRGTKRESAFPDYWLANPTGKNLLIGSSRAAIQRGLQLVAAPAAPAPEGNEWMGMTFDFRSWKSGAPKSELLAALGNRIDLRFSTEGERLSVSGSSEVADARLAKRARRILDGLVATLASELPQDVAAPLDERFEITSEGNKLTAKLELTPGEFKAWINSVMIDIQARDPFSRLKREPK
jgi:hypothetical protein